MNWIDVVFILIFLFFVIEDSRRGFLRLCADLIGLVVAFAGALIFYLPLGGLLAQKFALNDSTANTMSFLLVWLILQLIFFGISKIISYYTSIHIKESKANLILAYIPATLKALAFIVITIILILALPLSASQQKVLNQSFVVGITSKYSMNVENDLQKIFGNDLGKIVIQNETEETILLKFKTTNMTVDEQAENTILNKINLERKKVGAPELVADNLIRNVARSHSRDMLVNGYFSHTGNDGQTLFDRLVRANVSFQEAAENIALAPTADAIHTGLMNSPKHKANILNPNFTRIGLGVENAGQYGLMVTEDFAN